MVLYLPCRVVVRIDVRIGKDTRHDSAKFHSPGKNLNEVFGV